MRLLQLQQQQQQLLLPLLLLLLLLLVSCLVQPSSAACPDVLSTPMRRPLTPDGVQQLCNASSVDQLKELTAPILIERSVGSAGHAIVRDYIVNWLRKLNWRIEELAFEQETPVGLRRFVNIVATAPQAASRWLVLAAHYDSKLMTNFIGATDSAVPCGMLLQLAQSLTPHLPAEADVGLRFVFFDGEEAFVSWTSTDSIYGARHLAELLRSRAGDGTEGCNSAIKEIDTLMLMDLIGYTDSTFYYNPHAGSQSVIAKEKSLFLRLVNAERQLRSQRLLASSTTSPTFFRTELRYAEISDDHLPFRAQDVPVVHVIAQPFPPIWHTVQDNAAIVNWQQAHDINLIVQLWTAEYVGVQL